ncbi:ankyrin-1 [Trichonephila clavipes]|nr:ankyrin-1 [Trichonephila clavipes]
MTPLTRAVLEGNHEEIKRLLQYYRHLERANLHGFEREIGMLFHMTVNIDTAKLLLEHGAVINVTNVIKETPLFTAARNRGCPIEYMEFLIASGADVNAKNYMEDTPLHCAIIAQNYKVDIIRMFVRNGANINALNSNGDSPLHIVTKNSHLRVDAVKSLKEILMRKIVANFVEMQGEASHYHSSNVFDSPVTIVKELIENGANTNLVNSFGKSILHLALEKEDLEIVTELIKNEANTHLVTLGEGYAPLHIAVNNMNSKLSIVEAILETNVQVDPLDKNKNTPLHLAVGNHNTNFDIIKKLLNSGANINAKNFYGNTPLHISAKLKPNVMEELLKRSPDIDARNRNGDTPLTVAVCCSCSCPDVVKCLLKAGADPNSVNRISKSPLQLAVKKCDISLDIAKEALIVGILNGMTTVLSNVMAYLDFLNKDTHSLKKSLDDLRTVNPPCIEESRRSKLLTIEYLLAYGAVTHYKALQGLSPLDIAVKKLENQVDNGSCAKLLIKYDVLRNYTNNLYMRIVNLNRYKSFDCYKELQNHFEVCIAEVKSMNQDRIRTVSLFEYLTKRNYGAAMENSGSDGEGCCSIEDGAAMENSVSDGEGCLSIEDDPQIVDVLITSIVKNKYPIYRENLIQKVKISTYLSKIRNHRIYCYVEDRESEGEKKRIYLDSDTTLSVMKYLKRSDLLNLTLAFFYNTDGAVLPEPPKTWSSHKRTRNTSTIGPEVAKFDEAVLPEPPKTWSSHKRTRNTSAIGPEVAKFDEAVLPEPPKTWSSHKRTRNTSAIGPEVAKFDEAVLPEPPKTWSSHKRTRNTSAIGPEVAKFDEAVLPEPPKTWSSHKRTRNTSAIGPEVAKFDEAVLPEPPKTWSSHKRTRNTSAIGPEVAKFDEAVLPEPPKTWSSHKRTRNTSAIGPEVAKFDEAVLPEPPKTWSSHKRTRNTSAIGPEVAKFDEAVLPEPPKTWSSHKRTRNTSAIGPEVAKFVLKPSPCLHNGSQVYDWMGLDEWNSWFKSRVQDSNRSQDIVGLNKV